MASVNKLFNRRRDRVRANIKKKGINRVRLTVFRSQNHIYAQLIDDVQGITLASASSMQKNIREKLKSGADVSAAKEVGKQIALVAKKANVVEVVFDKGGYLFHGRVKALADAARENGLVF